MSNPLRNPNIDYERGWFSVTVQVAHNKSVFGPLQPRFRGPGPLRPAAALIRF